MFCYKSCACDWQRVSTYSSISFHSIIDLSRFLVFASNKGGTRFGLNICIVTERYVPFFGHDDKLVYNENQNKNINFLKLEVKRLYWEETFKQLHRKRPGRQWLDEPEALDLLSIDHQTVRIKKRSTKIFERTYRKSDPTNNDPTSKSLEPKVLGLSISSTKKQNEITNE